MTTTMRGVVLPRDRTVRQPGRDRVAVVMPW
jgi:hypothetical protein